jgi:hypothetical protein
MRAQIKLFHTAAICRNALVLAAVLGLAWGCGGGAPSQISPDEEAVSRAQKAADAQKRAESKKRLVDKPISKKAQ